MRAHDKNFLRVLAAANFSDGVRGFHRAVAERVVDVQPHLNFFAAVQKAFQLVLIFGREREHRYVEISFEPKNPRVGEVHALTFEPALPTKNSNYSVFGG